MVNNLPKIVTNPINTDGTVTEIKEEKVVYENGSCDIQVMCTLNSSFSIINRSRNINKIYTKTFVKNKRDEEKNICVNTKKRKYSAVCNSRNIDDSLKSQEIWGDEVIKNEMLCSTPITSLCNKKRLKIVRGFNNNKNTNAISKKYNECHSKINSTMKSSKKKENKRDNNVNIELGNVLQELETVEENEEVSDIDKEKLKNIHVILIHEVPPQHQIEHYAASHAPTYQQTKLFKKYGPLRKGAFSQQEDNTIKKNWEMFCKLHNWDSKKVKPFLSFKYKGKFYIPDLEERQNFLRFLANNLPWRTLHSVYGRFKNLYSNHICKRYNPEEDKKILSYMQNEIITPNKHKKFSDLAKILNRTRQSIWMHYQHLMKKHDLDENNTSLSQIQWTLPLITKYIKKLFKVTKCQNIEELKNATIPKAVWEKLETKLHIDYKILRKFWLLQLHMQLFCPNPIYLNDVKIQLIEYIYGKGISHAKGIVWSHVVNYFDGMTSSFLNKTFSSLMKEFDVKQHKDKSFLDAIEYLYENKITEIREQKTDKYLPRIQYKNGKIELFSEEKINKPNTDITACQ